MTSIPGLIVSRVVEEIGRGSAIDVYKTAQDLKGQLPEYSFEEIARLIAEEVAVAHGAAVWDRKKPGEKYEEPSSD